MIHVLLATFRPDPDMLSAQVDSIRRQSGVEVNLVVREDVGGDGACSNFAALLAEQSSAISDSDYIAFSDQDDIWLDDKLAKTLDKMREMERRWGAGTPLLVRGGNPADSRPLLRRLSRRLERGATELRRHRAGSEAFLERVSRPARLRPPSRPGI